MFASGGRWGKLLAGGCGVGVWLLGLVRVGIVRVCLVPLFLFCSVFSVVFICWLLFSVLSREVELVILCFWLLVVCVLFDQFMYMPIVYINEFWRETLLIPQVQK